MNTLILVCLSIAGIVSAGPAYNQYNVHRVQPVVYHNTGAPSAILRQNSDIQDDGHYSWSYETDNGIVAHESGLAGHSVEGAARWVSPEGTPIDLTYTADENGYHPVGNAIPVAPPVPEAIARALVYIQQHPYDENAVRSSGVHNVPYQHFGGSKQVYKTVPVQPVYKNVPVQPVYKNAPVQPVYKNVPVKPVYKNVPVQPAYRPVNQYNRHF